MLLDVSHKEFGMLVPLQNLSEFIVICLLLNVYLNV